VLGPGGRVDGAHVTVAHGMLTSGVAPGIGATGMESPPGTDGGRVPAKSGSACLMTTETVAPDSSIGCLQSKLTT
jgi:hypothetical protein